MALKTTRLVYYFAHVHYEISRYYTLDEHTSATRCDVMPVLARFGNSPHPKSSKDG